MRRPSASIVGIALILGSVAAACGDDSDDGPGLPNPASVHCEERGGTLEIETRDDGQIGICVLPSGERVEEWELYRRDSSP